MMDKGGGISYSKKRETFPKECTKFNPIFKKVDTKSAVAYIKLRDDGCPKKDALAYCTKTICKMDSTKTRDGPTSFRKLKIRKEKNPVTHNGWLDSMPLFDLGKNYISSIYEIIKDPENHLQVKNIKEADKQNCDFKEKIKFLFFYYMDFLDRTKILNLRKKYEKLD